MFEEDEEEYERDPDESKGAKVWRTVKTVVRCLVFTVIFGVILLLLARMFMSGDPASMKALSVNDRGENSPHTPDRRKKRDKAPLQLPPLYV